MTSNTKLQSIECIVVIAPLARRRSNYAFAACRKSREGQEDRERPRLRLISTWYKAIPVYTQQ